jgi:riboflavin kinase/FMN adenylyltransferase
MNYTEQTTEFYSSRRSAVTLGKFDGLHRGHQKLIREVSALQKAEGLEGIAFTIAPEQVQVLLTPEEKREMLEGYGMDQMIRCPFIPEVLGMEPEEFISEILAKKLQAKYVVVGTDFRFGHHRHGNVQLLHDLQEKYDYTVRIIEKECYGEREISSTYVREALSRAEMELVNTLLGYEYPVRGVIEHGKKLGRTIGMPTINLIPPPKKLLPPHGVYFSRAVIEGQTYHGVTNIGRKPTVDGTFVGVETYLFGTEEDLYGKEAEVRLLSFRRPERKFASVEELKTQMECDIQAGREYFHVS